MRYSGMIGNAQVPLFLRTVFCLGLPTLSACQLEMVNPSDPLGKEAAMQRILMCALQNCDTQSTTTRTIGELSVGMNAHTVLRFPDGTMRAWGGGSNGRLGNNGNTNTADGVGPSIIATGDIAVGGKVTQISAGHQSTCAVLDNGSLRCWGYGGEGRLGYNSTSNVADGIGATILATGDVPVGASVTQVAAGPHFTCAILSTNTLRCWGASNMGETGYSSTATVGDGIGLSIIATGDVPLGGTPVQISIGGSHACARLSTGKVRCWGFGGGGRLGYGNTANVGDGIGLSIISAGDVPIGADVTQITAGDTHTCALLTTGAVRCWGNGSAGALGYGSTAAVGDGVGLSISARGDVPLGGTAVYVSAGSNNTCAVLSTGAVRCWGSGSNGRLGYGSASNVADGIGLSIIARGDVPLGTTALQVVTSAGVTCALLDSTTTRVRCWGGGGTGALGYNSAANVGDGIGLSISTAGDVPIK